MTATGSSVCCRHTNIFQAVSLTSAAPMAVDGAKETSWMRSCPSNGVRDTDMRVPPILLAMILTLMSGMIGSPSVK
eukprot:CAMPEP_0169456526 /NCGR_PEP_ID=MMETSP1042-20121227/16400_1 /TAXON_ID=464988 /ORGANISM="Hemiselmis andersenii, Strain CCMP1180" /LENGTH=75 /DNA_ID=CAMNT_0009568755 /DNA_START=12 /DNA_END=239 /DNA_ORIENTATION=+